jgi:integrase
MRGLCNRAGVKPFGFLALRNYAALVIADTHKVSAQRIQRILRHQILSSTERYIQKINDELKSTLELLSQEKIPQDPTPNKKEANQYGD